MGWLGWLGALENLVNTGILFGARYLNIILQVVLDDVLVLHLFFRLHDCFSGGNPG